MDATTCSMPIAVDSTSRTRDEIGTGRPEMGDAAGSMSLPTRMAAGARVRALSGVAFGVTMLGTLGLGSDSVTVSFM